MIKYLRYTLMHLTLLAVIVSIFAGGPWILVTGAVAGAFLFLGDHFMGDYLDEPEYAHPGILNALLYLVLPLLAAGSLAQAWMLGSGDFLGIGTAIQNMTGFDVFAARAQTGLASILGTIVVLGVLIAAAGTNVGHELTHRTWSRRDMILGRWMLAFSANPDFAVEHVYNHHARVATIGDPATARRKDTNFWLWVPGAIWHEHLAAWRFEIDRLRKIGKPMLSVDNSMLRGYAMVLALAGIFFAAAGWLGVAVFLATALVGKLTLEVANYMEHFGLVRVPDEPVQPRHSWNTNKRMSSFVLYSLTRHSAHHEQGDLPFWVLKPYPDAPEMPHGYAGTFLAALCPPLWRRMITPLLLEWDAKQASPAEREIAQKENALSDIAELRRTTLAAG